MNKKLHLNKIKYNIINNRVGLRVDGVIRSLNCVFPYARNNRNTKVNLKAFFPIVNYMSTIFIEMIKYKYNKFIQ